MDASNHAVDWILGSMVSMCPPAEKIVQKTMSDLGLGVTDIKTSLPNVDMFAVCTWHIMVIDFPKISSISLIMTIARIMSMRS